MTSHPDSPPITAPPWLVIFTIVAVVLGAYFRFTHLDTKVFWYDETWTAVHMSGRKVYDVRDEIASRRLLTAADLGAYMDFKPDTSALSVLRVLAEEDPKHPPLYYVLTRPWADAFGPSVASLRALAACFSMLMLPCVYWLCMELFDRKRTVALSAVAMMALTPIHVLYGQEAREYSLWTIGILLSSATLVRACRTGRSRDWALYAITAALGMYSFTLFALVQIVHALYVAAICWPQMRENGFHRPRAVSGFVLGSLGALLLYSPWIWQIIAHSDRLGPSSRWLKLGGGAEYLVKSWITSAAPLVLDLHSGKKGTPASLAAAVIVAIVALAGWIRMRREARWLSIGLVIIPAAALAIPDLLLGGVRSAQARYLMPAYVGAGLAMAFAVGAAIEAKRRRWLGPVALFLICVAGAISAGAGAREQFWWNKGDAAEAPEIGRWLAAQKLAPPERPFLLVAHLPSMNAARILLLSRLMDPRTEFLILANDREPEIPAGYEDRELYFALDPDRIRSPLDPVLAPRLRPIPPFKKLQRLER